MPLAHNLNKVKKIASKSSASMHVKGRKFKQLNRATLRDKKITEKKQKSLEQKTNELSILFFLQKIINEDKDFKDVEVFSFTEMKSFIGLFVSRFDDELNELREERRPGRPQTSRQQNLEEKVKHESHIFDTGYYGPDLSDKETVKRLRLWNGTSGATTGMKFVRISKDMTELPTKELEMS
ncbi:translation machinery-associated protein 16 [Scheffersomyces coipomensis]|uniref:translation machinery-associated protein 16 n=1 Tax=Scheffersomyces coipomensis TaxID=1788519 RepID=UPI00315CD8DF